MVLDSFPTWIDRALATIKSSNSNLKNIAHKEQGGRMKGRCSKERKIQENEVEFGPSECDIGKNEPFLYYSLTERQLIIISNN